MFCDAFDNLDFASLMGTATKESLSCMGKAIGIDLGTTNSCAAVVENNQPKIIMYKGGNYTIPSMFAVDEAGNKLVGHDAKKISQLNPASTVYGSKRLLGRNYGSKTIEKVRQLFTYEILEGDSSEVLVKIKDQVFSLEQVSAHILDKIREVSQEYLQDEIVSAVITVPAYFNERQRQAVRNAGKMAKLNVIRILNEPTAAALAYGLGKSLNQKLAVYDLGGGTFDISIIEVKDKIFEVIATGGDTMLGGIDFDNRLIEWILNTFQQEQGVDLSNNMVAVQRIKESAERAKIDLSMLEETRINIPFIARGPKGTLNIDLVLTREHLESLTKDLVDRTLVTCEKVLAEAKLGLKDLDEVLLVGGQSRMPLVQRCITEFFGKQPCKGVHPDEAVAVGAAIMAHSLTDQSYHKVELLDVLPMAIGIAKVDGSLLKLFPKYSPIPSYKSLILTNSKDNQKSIMLKIYQGDNEVAVENEILGTFIFSGIREAKKGSVKVEVLFHIDSEGILTLSAKDKDTGQQMETILKVKSSTEEGDDKKAPPKKESAKTPLVPPKKELDVSDDIPPVMDQEKVGSSKKEHFDANDRALNNKTPNVSNTSQHNQVIQKSSSQSENIDTARQSKSFDSSSFKTEKNDKSEPVKKSPFQYSTSKEFENKNSDRDNELSNSESSLNRGAHSQQTQHLQQAQQQNSSPTFSISKKNENLKGLSALLAWLSKILFFWKK